MALLWSLLWEIEAEQNEYENISWGMVRNIKSWDLLIVEKALRTILRTDEAPYWLYQAARDYVGFSRDVRSPFIPPTPKPDIAVPNAGPPLGDGGEDAPSGNIDRPRKGGKNGRLKASGIDVAAPNVSRPLKPRKCSLPRRNPPTPAWRRPARASAYARDCEFFCCQRPGCEEWFALSSGSPCQKFCSPSCRQALRRVIERERWWRQRARLARRQRRPGPCRGP